MVWALHILCCGFFLYVFFFLVPHVRMKLQRNCRGVYWLLELQVKKWSLLSLPIEMLQKKKEMYWLVIIIYNSFLLPDSPRCHLSKDDGGSLGKDSTWFLVSCSVFLVKTLFVNYLAKLEIQNQPLRVTFAIIIHNFEVSVKLLNLYYHPNIRVGWHISIACQARKTPL